MTAKMPIRCTRCGDEDGPFTASGLCEGCEVPADAEAELLSALEDGGYLDENARRLMNAYAVTVLQRARNGAAR